MDTTKKKKDLSTNASHEAAMDAFLKKLGLYRKPIAKDGSCLFRAVAEQVFNCQTEHARVRRECIEFMKKNKERFEAAHAVLVMDSLRAHITGRIEAEMQWSKQLQIYLIALCAKIVTFVEGPFDHHLYNLKSQKQWAGQVEINALSLMYKCDVIVYQAVDAPPINATENNCKKKVILCYSNGNHYDSIYPFEHYKNLAFCQSVMFDLLYEKIFPRLASIETANKPVDLPEKFERQSENGFSEQILPNGYGNENGEADGEGWITVVNNKKQGKSVVKNQKNPADFQVDNTTKTLPESINNPKLRWEIMRSRDPEGYRNIELEVWEETRKEQQQKDQTVAAAIQFKKGDRCQVKHPSDDQFYSAVINDIFDKTCKVWIPELKERKVVLFSNLKPNEHNSNSNYRDLSGYHRKSENYGDATRGNDDQKSGRRRRPNKSRKGNENFEKNQPEAQDEQSGRQRGDKNRRRNRNPRAKDDKKDPRNQGENTSQDHGFFEMSENTSSAFPALPGNSPPAETAKPNADDVANTNPATFWSKLHSPSPTGENETSEPSPLTGNAHECSTSPDMNEIAPDVTEDAPVNVVEDGEKILDSTSDQDVCHQDVGNDIDKTEFTLNHLAEDFKNTNVNDENVELYSEPPLLSKVNGLPDKQEVLETTVDFDLDQPYPKVNGILYTPEVTQPIKVLQNTSRQVVEEDLSPSRAKTDYGKMAYQEEEAVNDEMNGDETESFEVVDHATTPTERSDPLQHNYLDNSHQAQETVEPRVAQDHNQQSVSLSNIYNDVLNGQIGYSTDPEGKDMPKDMKILRHFYNIGFQSYCYSIHSGYSGGQPLSPVYPVMSPTTPMYTMHQPYQNQSMLVQQNMCQYPQMQVNSQEENQHQSAGEERREGSPGYKQNMSVHHSPQYRQHQMAQAMINMNYSPMYAQRHLYQNYMFPSPRANFQRYPQNKSNFTRQPNRKNRYHRNDNQQNMKLYNVQSGYGSDSKGIE